MPTVNLAAILSTKPDPGTLVVGRHRFFCPPANGTALALRYECSIIPACLRVPNQKTQPARCTRYTASQVAFWPADAHLASEYLAAHTVNHPCPSLLIARTASVSFRSASFP